MSLALVDALARVTPPEEALDAVDDHVVATVNRVASEPLRGMALEHTSSGGRRFRARLTLEATAALGIDPSRAVPFAAACELMHNATLIHDDLQDGDRVRRGRPALWVVHGSAQAINAGDLLLLAATQALDDARLEPELRWRLAEVLTRRGCRTACGQAQEMALLANGRLGWHEWAAAARGKTGHLLAAPVEGAARIAGMDGPTARALGDASTHVGLVFQIQDDIVDLFGDKGRGQRGNDLREGKVSALVVEHLARRPADTAWLLALLRRRDTDTTCAHVEEAAARFVRAGTLHATIGRARRAHDALARDVRLKTQPALHAILLRVGQRFIAPLRSLALHAGGGPLNDSEAP